MTLWILPSHRARSRTIQEPPKDIRSLLGIESGDKINFLVDDQGTVRFVPATKDVTALRGMITKPSQPVSLEAMDATIKKRGART